MSFLDVGPRNHHLGYLPAPVHGLAAKSRPGHVDLLREPSSEYISFVTWEPLTPAREAENSHSFWRWLMGVRAATHARGLTFRAYGYQCWRRKSVPPAPRSFCRP